MGKTVGLTFPEKKAKKQKDSPKNPQAPETQPKAPDPGADPDSGTE